MERKKIEGSLRISQIAEALGGHFEGEDILISGIKPVDQPVKDCLTPLFDKKWVEKALSGCAGAFLVPDGYGFSADRPVVFVKDIKPALSKVIELFYPVLTKHSGISEKAIVAGGASVHPSAVIEAGAIVEDCAQIGAGTVVCCGAFIGRGAVIGENCYIYPNVTIYYGCTLGDGVIIHSSAVVGSDGFGYYQAEGVSYKIPQVGGVVIGNDVEIGSCAAIDRGALGDTVIGEGTKIDNLVQVAHNTVIGKHCILAGQTGISGSCNIGDFVICGGNVGMADHINVASGAVIAARGGVNRDITEKGVYAGHPIMEMTKWLKSMSAVRELPEMRKTLKEISKRVDDGLEKNS